ncbi:heavy metal-associated isoprenylated plant protein 4-like [Panicum virgatum]|uniref:HMA domain-containing protein n=1 Tax=Panicum virgatum TaxID=38727 RepID=A0A8T0W1T8_PANVG|nr:heavy metal-associated isoprenylated plant protein 4-like [Panicum virgatum]KAG2643221.1 hypothetical protein PVAP13_2KG313100 [Panicum virgatum]
MKIVLKVAITCKKCKTCVLGISSKIKGIKSLTYDDEKSTLTVVGEVDVVEIVAALRKAKHPAEVVSVTDEKKEAEEKKKKEEEEKKKKEEEKKKEEAAKKKCCCPLPCPICPKACPPPPCPLPCPPPYMKQCQPCHIPIEDEYPGPCTIV